VCTNTLMTSNRPSSTTLTEVNICYRKDLGFFAPVTNELEAVVFGCLLELANMEKPTKWKKLSGLRHR